MSVVRIAAKAGVSIATVSRVLNNTRRVNPAIAERVRQAVEELQIPVRLNRKRPRSANGQTTIAIVSVGQTYREWFGIPVMAGVVAELTRAAQEAHMAVLMTEMPDPSELSPILRRPEVEGALVFIDSSISAKQIKLLRDHVALVRVLGGQITAVDIDHVGPDNHSVGYLAGKYLVSRGVSEVAYLTTEPSWDFSKLRAQGFIVSAESAGLNATVYLRGASPLPSGFYGCNVVAQPELTTLVQQLAKDQEGKGTLGLFVSRDEETVHLYPLLRQNGLEPGRDVVIVSCDNESVRLSTLQPRPASIDLSATEIGRYAVRRLASRIKHPDEPPVRILVSPKLIPGEGNHDHRIIL
jgi:LacI family transcriptional regulator